MDSFILKLLDKNFQLTKNIKIKIVDILFLAFVTVAAIYMRYTLVPTLSRDYYDFLNPWLTHIRELGGFESLSHNLGNYTPPYMYLLVLVSYLPISDAAAIKLITLVFDFVLAICIMVFSIKTTHCATKAVFAYAVTLFIPSLLLNGAVWGQCDVIYTSLLILSFVFAYIKKPYLCCIFFGLSFAFKLQAAFFVPVLLLFWVVGKLKLRHFIAAPISFLLVMLPAIIAGREFGDIMNIYFSQAETYNHTLSMNAPSVYSITGNLFVEKFSKAAIIFSIILVVFLLYKLYIVRANYRLETMLCLTIFTILAIVYFLPHMHERYAFAADVFSAMLFLLIPKYAWLFITTQFISCMSYVPYLLMNYTLDVWKNAVIYFVVLCVLGYKCYKLVMRDYNELNLSADIH